MNPARAAMSTAVATASRFGAAQSQRRATALASTAAGGGAHSASVHRLSKHALVPPANPPPTSERSLSVQRFYAQHRPLLEHEQLPTRPLRMMQGDLLVVEADAEELLHVHHPQRSIWRRRARRINNDTFASLLDRLSHLSVSPPSLSTTPRKSSRQARRHLRYVASRGFAPSSPAVHAASQHIERLEREEEAREQVMAHAIEHGEDVERAARLGSEAELVVLGEPAGPHKDWAPGVATHLGTHTQPYVPPGSQSQFHGAQRMPSRSSANDMDAAADEDAHLWLMQGLVHTRVHADHAWRTFIASTLDRVPPADVALDSVRRKRRKKMNKHKYKKLRKRQRAERQRLKK